MRSLLSVVLLISVYQLFKCVPVHFVAGVNRHDLEVQTVANTGAITEMISWCTDASTLFIVSGNPSYMAKGIIHHCRLYLQYRFYTL